MKTLALILILTLHATTLWPQVPHDLKNRLTTTALVGNIASPPPPAPVIVPTGPLPVQTSTTPFEANASSAVAVDAKTATTLYAKNPTTQRPIASVTKLITVLVILSRHHPTERVTIPKLPSYIPEAELMGLIPGETYTIGDLVQAALVPSANDAADALAIIDSGSITKFAAAMNLKMADWSITGTHFSNPSGLEDRGNYATADALAKIGQLALTNSFIRKTITQSQITIISGHGRTFQLDSTNKLLASGNFYGIKTGYTLQAGECFVGLTRIDDHEVITVVLGSTDRFGATRELTNWIGQNWQWL